MAGGLISFILGFSFINRVSALMIKLENGHESPSSLNVIENSRVVLSCDNATSNQRIVWRKAGDESFKIYAQNLTLDNILATNAGNFTCTDESNGASATVTINVLYPPTVPVVKGPSVVLKGQIYNLTCDADGNPEPEFQWTTVENTNAKIVARGRTYVDTMDGVYTSKIYCWVRNTMLPSLGKSPIVTKEFKKAIVVAAEPAYIWELHNIYSFNVSTDVSVDCKVTGSPPPEIWWTRQNDSAFRYNGATLFVRNVQIEFTGYYSCYAKNTVAPTGQSSFITVDVQHTLITIYDQDMSEECRDRCPSNTSILDENCAADCKNGLVAAAVIGWITACFLLALFLFYFIHQKYCLTRQQASFVEKRTSVSMVANVDNKRPLSSLTNTNPIPAIRPVLPVRPGVSRKIDEDHYAYVTEVYTEREPTKCSETENKADYLEPIQDPGEYLHLESKFPNRVMEDTNKDLSTDRSISTDDVVILEKQSAEDVTKPKEDDGYLTFIRTES